MKTFISLITCIALLALSARSATQPIPGTDLVYKGPGTVTSVTDPGQVADLVTNAPCGGLATVPQGLVAIIISNATGGSAKIQAESKSSSAKIAVFIYGDTSMVQIDCGQSSCDGELYYLYVKGAVTKVLLKGLTLAGKVVADNGTAAKGIQIMNISKGGGPTKDGGVNMGGGIHSVIVLGKLDKLHSNHGGFGGTSGDPGVIAVIEPSPKAQVKCKGGVSHVLLCSALQTIKSYDYAAAYAECIASNAVLPYVGAASLQQLNTKLIGPAVCSVQLEKLCNEKKTTVVEPLVGRENVIRVK